MTGPEQVWIHRETGQRFHVLATLPTGTVLLRRVDPPSCPRDLWGFRGAKFETAFVLDRSTDTGLVNLLSAIDGLADALRKPGQPHPVEYSAGPVGPGPLWEDARLWDDFDRADRLGGPEDPTRRGGAR